MENNLFKAEGQLLFIEPSWITGETCVFTIHNPFQRAYAKSKLFEMRKAFVNRLEKEGFVITYDKNDNSEDIIYLIMNESAIDEELDDFHYKKEFDNRMFEAGGEKLNYPYTISLLDYFNNPFYPAVLKNESVNGGIDKFLIEMPEQVEIIKKFYNDFLLEPKYNEIFNYTVFQQLIETPTNKKTYMRVLMSASGDVMGVSLKYSKEKKERRTAQGIYEKHFWNSNSPYYLNCTGMFNYYSGGESIYFSQSKFNFEQREILKEHGIDSRKPTIPNDILEVSKNIASKCNKELGIMCGIDFILNEKDNKWYYLEIQAFPAIEEWMHQKGINKINTGGSVDDYIKYCELELEARHDALMLLMKKKMYRETKENTKIYQLTK